jgi:dTDP-4-dehydrorhamnose reductase
LNKNPFLCSIKKENKKVKKILITGANGLLGQKLVSLYSQTQNREKYQLIATSRGESRINTIKDFEYQSLDITQPEEIEAVFSKYKPDAVIHTAAMTQVDDCETAQEDCWLYNTTAVEYLVKACETHNSFFLHLSTDFIFDGEEGPYTEEAKPNPVSYYGESKLAAEEIVMKSQCSWAIARTVLVYGITEAMSRSNIILWVKKSLEDGKTIQVVDDQLRSPTLAEDLAQGCALIVEKEAEGIFNISGKELLTPYEMAIQTADFFELDKSLIVRTDASKFSQTAKRPPRTGFILDKAQKILDYQPHSFKQGIAILQQQLQAIQS